MPRPISVLAALTTTALFVIAPLAAADDASFGNDLKATIALQGMPCDQVVQAKRNGDSDYTAACRDGNKYHVFVDPKGRVVVQKL
jgi:hypothetical protein